jgi:hypothetical protein
MSGIKSRNNNVFHYSSYWGNWSRILFHDSKGTEIIRRKYNIPSHILTLEVDVTAINPLVDLHWESHVARINIRGHCTAFDPKDKIVGSLREDTIERMQEHLSTEQIESLLHSDFLPFIDWDLYSKMCNGGAPFAKISKMPMVITQYLAMQKHNGAGPGLLIEDVREEYNVYSKMFEQDMMRLLGEVR